MFEAFGGGGFLTVGAFGGTSGSAGCFYRSTTLIGGLLTSLFLI